MSSSVALLRVVGSHTEVQCRCPSSPPRLLMRATTEGVYLWCRECRRDHLIPWNDLHTARQEIVPANHYPGDPLEMS